MKRQAIQRFTKAVFTTLIIPWFSVRIRAVPLEPDDLVSPGFFFDRTMSKISRNQEIKPFFRFLCASHELVCTLCNLFVALRAA